MLGVVLPDATDLDAQPGPPGTGELVVPEVVQPEGIRQACPGCLSGDTPHRQRDGKLRPGHCFNGRGRPKGSRNNATRLAVDEMRQAVGKAVRTLVKCLDDPNPWVALTASRTIVERIIPAAELMEQRDDGPVLVFPPGTHMALFPVETREAIAELKRRVPNAEPGD